jgi:serine/threonine protein kinase
MDQTEQRQTLGSYEIVRELVPCAVSRRWFAVHAQNQTSHVLYELGSCRDRAGQRRFVAAVQSLAQLHHAHILPVESLTFSRDEPWLVTPYTGNQEGLVTLGSLAQAKGGSMSGTEAARALVQLLAALEYAQVQHHTHGPIAMDEVLVDRHGSVSIELFGLSRALKGLGLGNAELRADEVRSIVEMGYQLVTGRIAEEPRIAACKLSRTLDRRWDDWFAAGLDPVGGFRSAGEALEAFPTRTTAVESGPRAGAVKVVIGRVRSALRQGS